MKRKIYHGKLVAQPVIVPMHDCLIVLVSVDTEEEGVKKFYCREAVLYSFDLGSFPETAFADIVLSSVGDEVCIQVFLDSSDNSDVEIIFFTNCTQKLRIEQSKKQNNE